MRTMILMMVFGFLGLGMMNNGVRTVEIAHAQTSPAVMLAAAQ